MNKFDELHEAIVNDSSRFSALLEASRDWLNDKTSKVHPPPLHTAAAWGRDEMVEQLLDAGADVNLVCEHDVDGAFRSTPVDVALLHQHSSTSSLLLNRGAEPGFFTYVGLNDLQAVRESVTKHPEKLTEDRFFPGCLPIHFAAAVSSNAMIDLLCELGADVNARDAAGHSPLRYACLYFRTILVLQTLHAHGAQVNNIANDGTTPLITVCSHYETVPAVRWLLDHNADPNLTTTQGKSPLLVAVEHRVSQTVDLLIKHGADLEFRAANGMTALEYAEMKRYTELVQRLKKGVEG